LKTLFKSTFTFACVPPNRRTLPSRRQLPRPQPVLDRYATSDENFVLIAIRIAVLGARSAPSRHCQPAKGEIQSGYQGRVLGWFAL
jgi:hypothetical protein